MHKTTMRDWLQESRYREVQEDLDANHGVQHMDHQDLVASILYDLLAVHFISDGNTMLHESVLVRFVHTRKHKTRVYAALQDPQILELAIQNHQTKAWQLTPQREKLQKAMNIAGVWYKGYGYPPPKK